MTSFLPKNAEILVNCLKRLFSKLILDVVVRVKNLESEGSRKITDSFQLWPVFNVDDVNTSYTVENEKK